MSNGLNVIKFQGQPVVTLASIDQRHRRPLA